MSIAPDVYHCTLEETGAWLPPSRPARAGFDRGHRGSSSLSRRREMKSMRGLIWSTLVHMALVSAGMGISGPDTANLPVERAQISERALDAARRLAGPFEPNQIGFSIAIEPLWSNGPEGWSRLPDGRECWTGWDVLGLPTCRCCAAPATSTPMTDSTSSTCSSTSSRSHRAI